MTTPIFGLTSQGFNAARLADIKQFLENDFIASFGNVNTDPQSVVGQLIGIFAKSYADQWENLENVYFSQYPSSASGTSLDNISELNGISRLPATQTFVTATCQGLEGTLIKQNSLAKISATGQTFYAELDTIITRSSADIVVLKITNLAPQKYTVILNNLSLTFSLPVITFSNSGFMFVSGNVITLTLNGIRQAPINYASGSNATLALISAQISAFIAGTSCVTTNPSVISVTPPPGFNIIVNSISITGGASQASYVISFSTPANNNIVTAGLTSIINQNANSQFLAVDNMDSTFSVTASNMSIPFSCNFGTNISIIYLSSPVNFLCDLFGPVPCPINALDTIVTPIAGWISINNYVAGNTGTDAETDSQLRIRRQNSIKLLGSATVEAITAGLLQKVPGVTSAIVFENVSLQQTDIDVVFPQLFSAGDLITCIVAGISSFAVSYSSNQLTTMNLLAAAFQLLYQVRSTSVGGSGNQTLSIVVNTSDVITIQSITTSVSMQQALINGGRPPKSFEAVVEGGTDGAIAQQIWITKPAGIQTFGNTSFTITDSQGNPQVISFSRPTEIYIWVNVILSLHSEENFPTNGIQLVAQSILNYGLSLGVGIDVLLQRVLAQIFNVPGIASGDMTIAATTSLQASPIFNTNDISVADNQISIWDLVRISVAVA